MAVTQVAQDSFENEVLKSSTPVFVDFYADWCGPCKLTSPIVDHLAEQPAYKDKIKFVKIDVDANQDIASQYNIFSIPTFMIFKNGQPAHQFVGARDQGGFEEELQKAL